MSTYYLCGIGDLVAKSCLTLATGFQAPLSIGFPKKEYWSGLPCPSPGDLPDSGIEPRSPALQVGFFFFKQLRHQGSTHIIYLTLIQQMLIETILCLRNWGCNSKEDASLETNYTNLIMEFCRSYKKVYLRSYLTWSWDIAGGFL